MNQCQDITDCPNVMDVQGCDNFPTLQSPIPTLGSISHDLVCMDSLFIVQTIHTEWDKTLFF